MPVTDFGTAYDLHGPEGAPVVALIHGIGMSRALTWDAITPVLAEHFRVLSYDLPGHGESARPPRPPDLTTLAGQLITLMDTLGIACAALVGFSLGGMINRRAAMDHPGRVSALAVLNSPHERSVEAQHLVERRARDTSSGGTAADIDETLDRWFTRGFHQTHPKTVAHVRATVLGNDAGSFAALRQVLASGVTELIRPVPPITQPTLVMTCAHDSGSTPSMCHAIANEIPGAKATIVPDLQHMGLIEQPALFTKPILGFLEQTLATRQTT